MIERVVDYIQASLWLSEITIITKGFKPISPVRFYKRGYLHPQGFRMYFGNPNSPKAMVIASGETMQSLRNDLRLDAEILNWILSQDGNISRLDLAVTEWIEDELVTLEDVKRWAKEDLIDSTLTNGGTKTIASLASDGQDSLETVYIGDMKKRGKRGIFRAYDKGLELNIGAYLSTRLELELKREKAHSTAVRLAQSNDVAGNFRTSFNVRDRDFERLMDADAVPAVRGKNLVKEAENEEMRRRWDWLINQVAPALKEAVLADRKVSQLDTNLIHFMAEAGILEDMRTFGRKVVENMKRAKMSTIDLD